MEQLVRPPEVSELKKKNLFQKIARGDLASRGVKASIWLEIKELELECGPDFQMSLRTEFPQLSQYALEAGEYQLALNLGLNNLYDQGRALIFIQNHSALFEIIAKLSASYEVLAQALTLQYLRMSGKLSESLRLLTDSFLLNVEKLSVRDQGEVLLQVASVYFNCSNYQKAFAFYKLAFEKFEEAQLRGKMAIAAFNAAVAARYLPDRHSERTWLWHSQNLLKSYFLPNLQKTYKLYLLEKAVAEKNFSEAENQGHDFLNQSGLSLIQTILAKHALAQALTELGKVTEAEICLNQTRLIISQNHFFQYEINQNVLETNLESLTLRKIQKIQIKNLNKEILDQRTRLASEISQIRILYFSGKPQLASESFQQLLVKTKAHDLTEHLTEDLYLLSSYSISSMPFTNRAKEVLTLNLMMTRNYCQLIHLTNTWQTQIHLSGWEKILLHLTKAFVRLQSNQESAFDHAESALALAESMGLERLAAIAVGLSSYCNKTYHQKWLSLIEQMDIDKRHWFENFFRKAVGQILQPQKVLLNGKEIQVLGDLSKFEGEMDLIINAMTGDVQFMGEHLEISTQGTLLKILSSLAESTKTGLTKEELVEKVWGYEYNPTIHDSMIYTNIRRLRDLIPVELILGQYRIASNIKWIYIGAQRPSENSEFGISERQQAILELFARKSEVTREEIGHYLEISDRTVLRELTELVHKKLVAKSGAGRATKYAIHSKERAV
jgi:hypothetical protein